MKELSLEKMESLEGGKFWGWKCGPSYSIEPGSCYQTCTYRAFWINVSGSTVRSCASQ